MYCPRCGHQPISNELRFCSYCGFRLGVVKASLADEEETNASTGTSVSTVSSAHPVSTPPRHRDINIGVVLMFLGTVLAVILNERSGGIGREGGGFILTAWYGAILLLSSPIMKVIYKLLSWGDPLPDRLSTSRREMGFGATLMFVSAALSAVFSFLMAGRVKTSMLPIAILVTFALLLVISPHLLRALRYLIRDESSVPRGPNLISAPHEQALPPAQELPIAMVEPQRVTTAEIRVPAASVTEHTTGLLGEK